MDNLVKMRNFQNFLVSPANTLKYRVLRYMDKKNTAVAVANSHGLRRKNRVLPEIINALRERRNGTKPPARVRG